MLALFLFILSAFAGRPAISITATPAQTDDEGVANTMMFDVTVHYTDVASTNAHDHDVYIGVGVSSSAASTCANGNGTPSSPGTNWVYNPTFQVAPDGEGEGDLHFVVYNFEPGTAVYAKAAVGSAGLGWSVNCMSGTSIGTPTVPPGLTELNLTVTKPSGTAPQSDYVLFDTDDCSATSETHTGAKQYLVAVDTGVLPTGAIGTHTAGKIRWYLDIGAKTSETGTNKLTGWHYQAVSGNIVGVVEHGFVYSWDFDGHENYEIKPGDENSIAPQTSNGNYCNGSDSYDVGPCVSHDAFESPGGNTYVITTYESDIDYTGTGWETSTEEGCGGDTDTGLDGPVTSHFTDDGYSVWSGSSYQSDVRLVTDTDKDQDYDPTQMTPPNDGAAGSSCTLGYWASDLDGDVIDYTHPNSISVYRPTSTDWVNLSILNWNQVIRFDGTDGSIAWTLNGDGYEGVNDIDTFSVAGGVYGTASFSGQHGAHVDSGDNLVLFDNGGSRALNIGLTGGGGPGGRNTATINKSWLAMDPVYNTTALVCTNQGSAEMVGTSMLLDCNDSKVIEEYSTGNGDGTGGHAPDLAITLPGGTTTGNPGDDNACALGYGDSGGVPHPAIDDNIHGWYRAYPLTAIGAF